MLCMVISSTGYASKHRPTYRKPKAKVIESSIFLRVVICSPHTIGSGRNTMVRSAMILQLLRATRDPRGFSQIPGWSGSQYLASGRQVKTSLTTIPTPKATTRTNNAYATVRKALFERKIVM